MALPTVHQALLQPITVLPTVHQALLQPITVLPPYIRHYCSQSQYSPPYIRHYCSQSQYCHRTLWTLQTAATFQRTLFSASVAVHTACTKIHVTHSTTGNSHKFFRQSFSFLFFKNFPTLQLATAMLHNNFTSFPTLHLVPCHTDTFSPISRSKVASLTKVQFWHFR